jgi:hypothetical protein
MTSKNKSKEGSSILGEFLDVAEKRARNKTKGGKMQMANLVIKTIMVDPSEWEIFYQRYRKNTLWMLRELIRKDNEKHKQPLAQTYMEVADSQNAS